MKTLVEHHRDHDVYAHQLDPADRHAAAEFITGYLVPKIAPDGPKPPTTSWRTRCGGCPRSPIPS